MNCPYQIIRGLIYNYYSMKMVWHYYGCIQ